MQLYNRSTMQVVRSATETFPAEEDRSKNLIVFGLKEQFPALVTAVSDEIREKPHFEATRVGWKRPGIYSTAIGLSDQSRSPSQAQLFQEIHVSQTLIDILRSND